MIGVIILTSMVFVAYIIFRINKNKKIRYILSPIISLLYGFMLFFIGMGINSTLFLVLAVMPIIIVIFHTIMLKTPSN
jgi:hypothetical protein